MPGTVVKSALLRKMCAACVEQEKQLPECAARRFTCDQYRCVAQPMRLRQRSVGMGMYFTWYRVIARSLPI